MNMAGHFAVSTGVEQRTTYRGLQQQHRDWTDIVIGVCGPNLEYGIRIGRVRCTAVGTPRGLGGL
jgi:hypothetical protein